MRTSALLAFAALSACAKPEGDLASDGDTDTDSETVPDTDTDTDASAVHVLAADCALTDNALRVACTATLDAPGTATLVLSAPGEATRTFSASAGPDAALLGWGLVPETAYTWAIGDVTGTVTTGPLPAALAAADVAVTGTSWGFDAVLYPMKCPGDDYFTMVDGAGRIVWYEANDVYFDGSMTGYDWSQASKTVLSVNDREFREQGVGGDVVLALESGVDYDYSLHHDTARWGDLRYLMFEYPVGGLNVDGIHVFDGSTLLGTFLLGDHFAVPSTGTGDWDHANGLKVSDDGEIVLSLLVFNSVLQIDGDPASPTFLQIDSIANGAKGGLPDPDLVPAAGDGFEHQHDASRHGDDLWVFDNESQPTSRAVRMAIDDATGTLTETGSWSFDTRCPNQGGALPIDGGGVLASCANEGQVWEFEDGATEPEWTLEAGCGEQGGQGTLPILRGIPVTIE